MALNDYQYGPPEDFGTIAAYQPGVLNEGTTFGQYGVTGYKGPDINMTNTNTDSLGGTPYVPKATQTPAQTSRAVRTSTGSSVSYRPAVGTISEMKTTPPSGPAPTLGPTPAFAAPEWDTRAIAAAAGKKTAVQRSTLRRQANRALSAYTENPIVKGMNLERVLQGYGTGIAAARAEAEAAATREYSEKYSRQFAGAQMTYQAQQQSRMAEFEAAWQNYLKGYTTTQTTQNVYDTGELNPNKPSMGTANAYLGIA
jgi:hypothetical protein